MNRLGKMATAHSKEMRVRTKFGKSVTAKEGRGGETAGLTKETRLVVVLTQMTPILVVMMLGENVAIEEGNRAEVGVTEIMTIIVKG